MIINFKVVAEPQEIQHKEVEVKLLKNKETGDDVFLMINGIPVAFLSAFTGDLVMHTITDLGDVKNLQAAGLLVANHNFDGITYPNVFYLKTKRFIPMGNSY